MPDRPWEEYSEVKPWELYQAKTETVTAPSPEPESSPYPRTGAELAYRNLQGARSVGLDIVNAPSAKFGDFIRELPEIFNPIWSVSENLGIKPQTLADAVDTFWTYEKGRTLGKSEEVIRQELGEMPTRTPSVVENVLAGGQQGVTKALDFFASPGGWATLGLAAAPTAAQKIAIGAFTASMAKDVPHLLDELSNAIDSKDPERISRAVTDVGLTGIFTAQGAKHTLKVEPKAVAARAEEASAPLTAEATLREVPKEAKPRTPEESAAPVTEPALPIGREPELVGMGGAIPREFEVSPKTATGIKNATVDQERQTRGLPPAIEPARRSFGTVWDEAMARVDRDPGAQDRLIDELRAKPRSLTDAEDAMLLHRQIDLQNEYAKATRDLAQAFDDGRVADVELEKARVQQVSDKLYDLYEINKKVGTETGRGLNARKMMAYEDFSLARMELEKRAANEGAPLTEIQRAEIVSLHERIAETQRKYEEYVAKAEEAERQRTLQELIAKAPEPQINPYIIQVAEKIVGSLDKRAEAARLRLKEKMARTSAGVDPTILLDLAEIGASHIGHVGLDFAKWSTRMVEDVGEWAKEHLEEIYRESQKLIDADIIGNVPAKAKRESVKRAVTQRSRQEVNEAIRQAVNSGALDKIPGLVQNLGREFVRQGIKEEKALVDAIHSELGTHIPNITRQETLDAIGGTGRFTKPHKPVDKTASDLKFENEKIKSLFRKGLEEDRRSRRSTSRKIFDTSVEAANATRAIMTSFDLSAVLRQGGFISFAHPIRAAKIIPDMLRAMKSEKAQFQIDQEILARPNYPTYQRSGLYLAEHGHTLSKMEEVYMSRLADKIPGVAASQRAYTTFLNRLRADSFDAMAKSLGRDKPLTEVEARAISNFINVATGRGKLGLSDRAAVGLNTVFFAPRYVASRFQIMAGQPFYGGNARTRTLIAQEYARYLAGAAVVYTLGSLAGADIETDPRSSEFGKMRFGRERIDPMSGLLQNTVLISRLATGERKTGKGRIQRAETVKTTGEFLRNKLAPLPGAGMDAQEILTGQTPPPGHPDTLPKVAGKLLVPISYGDIKDAMVNQGIPEATVMAMLSLLGMGLQSYPEPGEKR